MIRHNGIEIDRESGLIEIHGRQAWLRPHGISFKAIEALIMAGPAGLTREQIYEITHGDCAEGGTIGGPHDVHVWLHQSFLEYFKQLGLTLGKRKDSSIGRVRYSLHVV